MTKTAEKASADTEPSGAVRFTKAAEALAWPKEGTTAAAALDPLADGLTQLIALEIGYYRDHQRTRRFWATGTRICGYLFGTLGLLVPLLAPITQLNAQTGYVLLALAASAIVGNRLFGATDGHIRFVTTMYALEDRLTQFGLAWARWKAKAASEDVTGANDTGFSLLETLRADVYRILAAETATWADDVRRQEDAFARNVGTQDQPSAATVARRRTRS